MATRKNKSTDSSPDSASPEEVSGGGNKRGLIAAAVVLIVFAIAAFAIHQKKKEKLVSKPMLPIERGERLTAPVVADPTMTASETESSSASDPAGDAILGSLSTAPARPPRPKSTVPTLREQTNSPSLTSSNALVANIIDEDKRRLLEISDRLKMVQKKRSSKTAEGDLPMMGDYIFAGFDVLGGFPFEIKPEMLGETENASIADALVSEQIPKTVKALNEKLVATQGFMMPLKGSFGKWTEFLVVENRANCCYGKTPRANEWIMVRAAGEGMDYVKDEVVTVFGTLHVGNVQGHGTFTGIYQMDCDKMEIEK